MLPFLGVGETLQKNNSVGVLEFLSNGRGDVSICKWNASRQAGRQAGSITKLNLFETPQFMAMLHCAWTMGSRLSAAS